MNKVALIHCAEGEQAKQNLIFDIYKQIAREGKAARWVRGLEHLSRLHKSLEPLGEDSVILCDIDAGQVDDFASYVSLLESKRFSETAIMIFINAEKHDARIAELVFRLQFRNKIRFVEVIEKILCNELKNISEYEAITP